MRTNRPHPPTLVILLFASLSLRLWADASSGTHVHSTGLGDPALGDMSSGMSRGGQPPGPVGGGSFQPPSPPPPPPPPPVYSPKVIKGSGLGVQSRVKALGLPGEPDAGERQPRTYSGDYDQAGAPATSEEVQRIGPRTIEKPTLNEPATSPYGF